MIPLLATGKVKMMGAMMCLKMDQQIVPDISPGIQGRRAYDLLSDQQKGLLKYALADYVKTHKCKVGELRWAFGKKTLGPAPLRIWRAPRVTVPGTT